MKVEKPIFVVGVGRSGSTIFHQVFAEHPHLTWLSSEICDRFPDKPALTRLHMQLLDLPFAGRLLRRKFSPGEPYRFWEYHCKGFSEPCRDLGPGDVTKKIKAKLPAFLSKMLTPEQARLLVKITGWPRVGFLHEIFPDAKFIHVKREWGAVINSMINVDWWWGWRGPQNWRWGELTPSQQADWERFGRSFIALAGIELVILSEAMETAKAFVVPDNFMEIRYEDFCVDPVGVLKEAVEFCELEWVPSFERSLQSYRIESTNYKWKEELTEAQQEIVAYFVAKSTKGEPHVQPA